VGIGNQQGVAVLMTNDKGTACTTVGAHHRYTSLGTSKQ
jgi:hypothetical protein